MKHYLISLMVGICTLGFQGSTLASQSPESSIVLKTIRTKMEKRQALTEKEEAALTVVRGKVQKSGGDMTVLSPLEQTIFNQDRLNKTSPTLDEILESGFKFLWGLDLDLVEKRRGVLRKSVGGGGADFSSVVGAHQKILSELKKLEDAKKDFIEKIRDLTEKMKKVTVKDKLLLGAEQATLKQWQDEIVKTNSEIARRIPMKDQGIKSLMESTGLERSVLEKLPDLETWKDMKAHPENIPQKAMTIPFSRPRPLPKAPVQGSGG